MSDGNTQADDAPAKTYTEADIKKRETENAGYRQKIRDLKARLAELEPKAKLADELQEKSLSESERAAAKLAELQAKIAEREAALDITQRKATLANMMLEANVDPAHSDILNFALPSLPLDDQDKMTEILSRYAKKTAVPGGKAVNPAKAKTGEIDWGNLSDGDIETLLKAENERRAAGW
jgi:chromosome condensin MukBEF ATPase and DNA-binding subunit MukB